LDTGIFIQCRFNRKISPELGQLELAVMTGELKKRVEDDKQKSLLLSPSGRLDSVDRMPEWIKKILLAREFKLSSVQMTYYLTVPNRSLAKKICADICVEMDEQWNPSSLHLIMRKIKDFLRGVKPDIHKYRVEWIEKSDVMIQRAQDSRNIVFEIVDNSAVDKETDKMVKDLKVISEGAE
jgi:hypothetical protein